MIRTLFAVCMLAAVAYAVTTGDADGYFYATGAFVAWDQTKFDEAIDTRARLGQEFAALSLQLNDDAESVLKDGSAPDTKWTIRNARHAQIEREMSVVDRELERFSLVRPTSTKQEPSALARYMRQGAQALSTGEKAEMVRAPEHAPADMGGSCLYLPQDAPLDPRAVQNAAAAPASDNAGWQSVLPRPVYTGIVEHLVAFGGHHRAVSRFSTSDGNQFTIPSMDDSGETGEMLAAQNTAVSEGQLPAPTNVVFVAFTFSSKYAHLTREMLVDAAFNIDAYTRRTLSRRIGRALAAQTMSGTGVSAPEGLLTGAALGVTAAAAAAITPDELDSLVYSVDDAYLGEPENMDGGPGAMLDTGPGAGGMVGYLVSRSLEKTMRGFKDSQNRPLWRPSIRMGLPNEYNGYPYRKSQQLEAVAAGKTPALFGNFSFAALRMIGGIEVFAFFDSSTARNNRMEFIGFARYDHRIVGAKALAGATNAGKCLAFAKLTMKA